MDLAGVPRRDLCRRIQRIQDVMQEQSYGRPHRPQRSRLLPRCQSALPPTARRGHLWEGHIEYSGILAEKMAVILRMSSEIDDSITSQRPT